MHSCCQKRISEIFLVRLNVLTDNLQAMSKGIMKLIKRHYMHQNIQKGLAKTSKEQVRNINLKL